MIENMNIIIKLFYLYGLVWKCLLVRRLVRYPAVNPSIPGVQIQFLGDNQHYKNYLGAHFPTKYKIPLHLVIQPGAVSQTHLQSRGAHNPVRAGPQHAHNGDKVVPEHT